MPVFQTQRTSRAAGRRGRPSRNDYVRLVIPLIRADVWALNECTIFSGYPAVQALTKRYQREILPVGVAIKCLLDRAVSEVIALGEVVNGTQMGRVTTFLQLWYREEQTVANIARQLALERTHVVKTVQRPALELVARRFLTLAEQVDSSADYYTNLSEVRRIIA
jgi:hypothetical protein